MGANMDSIELQIAADASKANAQLDMLVNRLTSVCGALQSVNSGGLQGLSNSVRTLSNSMSQMKSVTTPDFNRLAKNISKLSSLDTSRMNKTASAMNTIGSSLSHLTGISEGSIQIGEMAKNISKFGYKSVDNAIANMPKLATALNAMMASLSKAPNVSKNLIQMTTALAGLASSGSKVGSATRTISSSLLTYSSGASRATSKTHSLAMAIGKLYAKFWILIRVVKWLGNSVESSMNFLETVNYYNVALKQIGDDNKALWKQSGYDSAESYASSFQTRLSVLNAKMTGFNIDKSGNMTSTGKNSLGLDPNAVMNAEATYAQMANSMGVVGQSAMNVSKAFTMLGADWSSLKNISLDSAWEKFASAMAGQSRAVRSLGIDITQTTLQQYAYKYGLTQSVSEMNQATKTQLRLLAILDQSKVAYGDLANTIKTPANQLRILRQNFAVLGRTIGNLLLPIIQATLPYINAMVIALQRLFSWVAGLMGINLKNMNTSIGSASGGIGDVANNLDDADDSMSNLAGDAGTAGSNINEADKAAKKLKRTIMGFDEINALNEATTASSSGSGSGSGSGGSSSGGVGGSALLDDEIASALANYDAVWNKAFENMDNQSQKLADKIVKAFKEHDYTGIGTYISNGISGALNKVNWKSAYKGARSFGTGLAQFLNGLLTPKLFKSVGKTAAGALNTALYTAFSFGKELKWNKIGGAIASGINTFFSTFDFKTFGKTINTWVHGIFDLIKSTIKNIKWKDVLKGMTDLLSEIDLGTISIIIGGFALKMLGKILTAEAFKKAIIDKLLGTAGVSSIGKTAVGAAGIVIPVLISATVALAAFNLLPNKQKTDDKNTEKAVEKGSIKEWIKAQIDSLKNFPAELFNAGGSGILSQKNRNDEFEKTYKNGDKPKLEAPDLSKGFGYKIASSFVTSLPKALAKLKVNFLPSFKFPKMKWPKWKLPELTFPKFKLSTFWKGLGVKWPDWKLPKLTFPKFDIHAFWNTVKTAWPKWKLPKMTFPKFGIVKEFNKAIADWPKWKLPKLTFPKWKFPDFDWPDWKLPKLTFPKFKFPKIKMPSLHVTYDKGVSGVKKALVEALGLDGWPSLAMYKNGGFPEDGLFMANSKELVGRFTNGKTAVANNGQIIEGIRQATYDGYAAALAVNGGSNNQTPVIENTVKLNDEVIYKASQRGEKAYNKRYKTVCQVT